MKIEFKYPENLKAFVENLLLTEPKLRDNDYDLIFTVWWECLRDPSILDTITAKELFRLAAHGSFPNPYDIVRYRQQLQKNNEQTRGTTYQQRQRKGHKTTKLMRDASKNEPAQP